jgi:hypothetical protein
MENLSRRFRVFGERYIQLGRQFGHVISDAKKKEIARAVDNFVRIADDLEAR